MPRFYCPAPLDAGQTIELPAGAARHAQVLRLQPGARITLFNGAGGEFDAQVQHMGRGEVRVQITQHRAVEREARREVHLVVGMPANERMDWLVEKATELGAASFQPVVAERSVLKLKAERAAKKQAHWQGIAVAACEQCGRNRVPVVFEVTGLGDWIGLQAAASGEQEPGHRHRLVLSLDDQAKFVTAAAPGSGPVVLLSGPEGGLSRAEEAAALAAGFARAALGPRVLRAETAPLAALVLLAES
ncbi:MAG TPA: 16S rRNA (uracil(1498)-N(3))-methyltransferase [Ramlibacter sp.]|nr:16S rRNA (uracil(1498)-N(3))-methyltransferase [Ramlibacter sp.]